MYLSVKKEIVNKEEVCYFWLEFVDRAVQPNYQAQRGIDMKEIPPGAMTKTELAIMAGETALASGITVLMHME